MSETTTPTAPATTTPATPAPADKPARTRGPINKKYLAEITACRDLAAQAQKPGYATLLDERQWHAADTTSLLAKAAELEEAAKRAVGRGNARKMSTEQEDAARADLLAALLPIRTGAKRQYRGAGNEAGRDAYFVNEPGNASLERLLFIAGEILRKLTPQPPATGPEDTLKGVTAADIAALAEKRAAYSGADDAQGDVENEIKQARADLDRIYAEACHLRIDLQLAADQALPYTDPANAPIRAAFGIPEDRPASE